MRSSSHRHSSMHRSSHSSLSRHSSLHRHSSLRHSHHSGLSRHSLHSSFNRMGRHHGISNAHAFAVGKATGININSSAMGAVGAALNRSRKRRMSLSRSSSRRFSKINSRIFFYHTNKRRYNLNRSHKYNRVVNDYNFEYPTIDNSFGTAFTIIFILMFVFTLLFMFFMILNFN